MTDLGKKFLRSLTVGMILVCLGEAVCCLLVAGGKDLSAGVVALVLMIAVLAGGLGICGIYWRARRIFNSLNALAYKDPLTGVRNRASYLEWVKKLRGRMGEGTVEFGIVMLDVNFLKETNDNYGHDRGDRLLQESCRIICQTFQHSPVFRFGGDEFVVILENNDLDRREALLEEFARRVREINEAGTLSFPVSISLGMAIYDPGKDRNYDDTFDRADKAMYENKKDLKARMEHGKRSAS